MVDEGIEILGKGRDVGDFGKLLHESWRVKRRLTPEVSNSSIEEIYHQAIAAGALDYSLQEMERANQPVLGFQEHSDR